MTKSDLIDVLCEAQKLPKGRAELLVQVVFEALEDALKRDERIEIRGFGSFEIRQYKAYEGRNPRTGVTVSVQPKRLPFFKVGKELKERVDAGARLGVARSTGRVGATRAPAPAHDGTPVPVAVTTTGPVAEDAPDGDASTGASSAASAAKPRNRASA